MRKAILTIVLIMTVLSLPIFSYAHSGGTDANGGHRDRSTGEYHYHHGYSAHDHYDMDGDGDLDCPYDFKDNTANSYRSTPAEVANVDHMRWISYIVFVEAFFIVWLIVLCVDKHKQIRDLRETYISDLAEVKADYEERSGKASCSSKELLYLEGKVQASRDELNSLTERLATARLDLQSALKQKVSTELDIVRIRNAPLDITFAKDGYPIYWEPDTNKPYGDFTVYDNSKTKIFHTDRCCAPYFAKQTHLFKVINSSKPCRKCAMKYNNYPIPKWFMLPHK